MNLMGRLACYTQGLTHSTMECTCGLPNQLNNKVVWHIACTFHRAVCEALCISMQTRLSGISPEQHGGLAYHPRHKQQVQGGIAMLKVQICISAIY